MQTIFSIVAVLIVFLATALQAQPPARDELVLNPEQFDRAAYVFGALANLQKNPEGWATLAAMEGMNGLYEKLGPEQFSKIPSEWLDYTYQTMLDESRGLIQRANGTVEGGFFLKTTAACLGAGAEALVAKNPALGAVLKPLVEGVVDEIGKDLLNGYRGRAQAGQTLLDSSQMGLSTVDRSSRYSRKNEKFSEVTARNVGSKTVVLPNLSWQQNALRDPNISLTIQGYVTGRNVAQLRDDFHKGVDQLKSQGQAHADAHREQLAKVGAEIQKAVGPKGHLSLKLDKLKEEMVGEFQALNDDITAKQTEILDYMKNQAARQRESEYDGRVASIKAEGYRSSVTLISGFAGLLDPQAGRALSVTGQATLQVYESLEKFRATLGIDESFKDVSKKFGGKEIFGALNLAAGIFGAASMIFSLFGGPSIEMIILQQIQALGKQIDSLQKQMHARFDQVDQKLDIMFATMLRGFGQVQGKVKILQDDVDQVRAASSQLSEQVKSLDVSLHAYIRDLVELGPKITARQCALCPDNAADSKLFLQCLASYGTYANDMTKGVVLASSAEVFRKGLGPKPSIEDVLVNVDAIIDRGDVWSAINSLLPGTTAVLNLPIAVAPVANPIAWSEYARSLDRFLLAHPKLVMANRPAVFALLEETEETGKSIDKMFRAFGNAKAKLTEDGKEETPAVLVAELYWQRLWVLAHEIQKRERAQEEKAFGKVQLALSAEAQPDTLPFTLTPDTITPCEGFTIPRDHGGRPTLPAQHELKAFIPRPVQTAVQLGLGSIEVCYEGVDWADIVHTHAAGNNWYTTADLEKPAVPANIAQLIGNNQKIGDIITRTHYTGHAAVTLRFRFLPGEHLKRTASMNPLLLSKRADYARDEAAFYGAIQYLEVGHILDAQVKNRGFGNRAIHWAHGNMDPNGVRTDSRLEKELLRAWSAKDGLLARFGTATNSTEGVPEAERHKAVTAIRDAANQAIAERRLELNAALSGELRGAGTLSKSGKAFAASRRLLYSTAQLTLPQSSAKSDAFRSVLYGPHSLPTLEQVMERIGKPAAEAYSPERLKTEVLPLVGRYTEVARAASSASGRESLPLLQNTLVSLELTRRLFGGREKGPDEKGEPNPILRP